MISQENAVKLSLQLKELEIDYESTASPTSDLSYNNTLSPHEAHSNQSLNSNSPQGPVTSRLGSKPKQFEGKNLPGLVVSRALKLYNSNLKRNGEKKLLKDLRPSSKTIEAVRRFSENYPQLARELIPIVRNLLTDEGALEDWLCSSKRMTEKTKIALRSTRKKLCPKLIKVMRAVEEDSLKPLSGKMTEKTISALRCPKLIEVMPAVEEDSLEPLLRKMAKMNYELSDFDSTFNVDELKKFWGK